MRVQLNRNGKYILCGCIIPWDQIKPGQIWAGSGGNEVQIQTVSEDWVCYSWLENGICKDHKKEPFAFQCRYCLVLLDAEIPPEILNSKA